MELQWADWTARQLPTTGTEFPLDLIPKNRKKYTTLSKKCRKECSLYFRSFVDNFRVN